jgi:putative PIN family toxin of toxin-antitoxin system
VKVVLDTNVFVSGVFFGGVPGRILEAWRDGALTLLVSVAILDEYRRVGRLLAGSTMAWSLSPSLRWWP